MSNWHWQELASFEFDTPSYLRESGIIRTEGNMCPKGQIIIYLEVLDISNASVRNAASSFLC